MALQISLDMFEQHSSSIGGSYGSTLPRTERLTPLMAVEAFLASGVPLHALDNPMMKDFLHHLGGRLPGARHLANHIPFVVEKEVRPVCLDACVR